MEGVIDLRASDFLERKFVLAFLKGLTSIKYRDMFKKAEKLKQTK